MQQAKKQSKFLTSYWTLFECVAQNRIDKNDIDLRQVHIILVSTIATIPNMWGHVYLVSKYVHASPCCWIGMICSLIHMLSPLLYIFTNNSFIVINTMLASGLTFICVTAYYSGGLQSFALFWVVAAPMLGGIAAGRKGATLWAIISGAILTTFSILSLTDHKIPNLISPEGQQYGNLFLLFGWLILASVLSFIFVSIREHTELKLKKQNEKVDSLFRVLFHDLANSLGRINIGHSIARRDPPGPSCARGLAIASEAADSMFEITQNVRKMYAASKGKADMDLILYPVVESLEYVARVFAEELEKKKLRIEWDSKKLEGLKVLVEPISFKNQVLGNIISNAIKFSKDSSTIHVTAYPLNQDYCTLEIKDSGIGMPPAILNNLFDLNKKTTRPGTSGEFGTGFGMHIMKSFMEIYQGEVKVESVEPGSGTECGTTFKLMLKGHWD